MESRSTSGPNIESKFSTASCPYHHGFLVPCITTSTTPFGLLPCPLPASSAPTSISNFQHLIPSKFLCLCAPMEKGSVNLNVAMLTFLHGQVPKLLEYKFERISHLMTGHQVFPTKKVKCHALDICLCSTWKKMAKKSSSATTQLEYNCLFERRQAQTTAVLAPQAQTKLDVIIGNLLHSRAIDNHKASYQFKSLVAELNDRML
jgi:hypothetical protein